MELHQLIEKNKLQLRTQEELANKFDELQNGGRIFNFRPEVLINYLTFESAKPHLKEEYVKEVEAGTKQWDQITTIEKCAEEFLDYMKFAWGKAEDERGISANRSVQKLGMWLWIMNRDDLSRIIEDDDFYNPYGAPALIEVCNQMGIEVPNSLIEFAKVKC
jgi:hypothetical protein